MRDASPSDGAWQATAHHGACSPQTPADTSTGSRQRRPAGLPGHGSAYPLTVRQLWWGRGGTGAGGRLIINGVSLLETELGNRQTNHVMLVYVHAWPKRPAE